MPRIKSTQIISFSGFVLYKVSISFAFHAIDNDNYDRLSEVKVQSCSKILKTLACSTWGRDKERQGNRPAVYKLCRNNIVVWIQQDAAEEDAELSEYCTPDIHRFSVA